MTGIRARIRDLTGWRGVLCALLAGMVLALGHAPVSQFWLPVLALPVILWRLEGATGPRGAARVGWLVGLGYFCVLLNWLVEPFMVQPEIHGWMAPFALIGMTGGLALFWAIAFGFARHLSVSGRSPTLLLVCCWAATEFARAHILTGFPWGLLAYMWVDTPAIQVASVIGSHGLGFLTLLAGLMLGHLSLRTGTVAVALIAACFGFGIWQHNRPIPERTEPLRVRIVQPNAAQHLKWLPEYQPVFFERLLSETRKPAERAPDVVIWPETAVPFLLGEQPHYQKLITDAAGDGAEVILGIRRLERTEAGNRWFNSLAVLGPDGEVIADYDKHHLVPFGEYMPLGHLVGRLGITGLTGTSFSAGPGPVALATENLPSFLPLICYEAVFPHEMQAPGIRPEWLIQVTNDGWFGKYSGPQQHFDQARVRAIEQGLPMARAANTGISAIIDARGRVISSLNLGEFGSIDADLPNSLPPTPYSRFGDFPAIVVVVSIFMLTLLKVIGGVSIRERQ